MRISELPGMKDQWYAIARSDSLHVETPVTVTLFGEQYVLWRSASGAATLSEPYCPHRGAHLSAGTVKGESIACCYHGWEFDRTGRCSRIPQLDEGLPIPPKAKIRTWPVLERYGLCWTSVGVPEQSGPPGWFEADVLGWRVQVDFFEAWATSALRIIDNNIDQSHPAFVHQGTFGDPTRPHVPRYQLERTEHGYKTRIAHQVAGVGPQMGIDDVGRRYERITEVELLDAVHTRIRLEYNGEAPDYCFYGSATPIDDEHSLYVRVSALEGDENSQPYAMFHAYSRTITLEDKVVLETTHGDFPIDVTSEVHLRCDLTTLEYRRYLAALAARVAVAT